MSKAVKILMMKNWTVYSYLLGVSEGLKKMGGGGSGDGWGIK
jgi:hypothetical protein